MVKKLINDIKFNYAREHILVLAKILSSIQYKFDNDLVVVPIPTSSSHVRQRGFDHTKILAKKFAKIRKLNYSTTLGRNHNHQQIGSSRKARSIQAKTAFYYKSKLPLDSQIMLLDDVVTTGSTVLAAVDCLQQAGHQNISILAVAHQPLE
ncbi:ComF family protein [Candidatus Saccharibacteria bacterium]|nr:ComF family protein [Candidatus Saccharibacteria bacterium]